MHITTRTCSMRPSTIRLGLYATSLLVALYALGTSAYELHVKETYRIYEYNSLEAAPPLLRAARGVMGVSLTLVLYLLPTTIISFIRPDRDWAFIPLVYLGVDVTALFMATCMAFGSMILSMTWLLASPPGYNNSYAACKASVNEGPVAANLTVGAKKPAFTVHHLSDGQCDLVLSTICSTWLLCFLLTSTFIFVIVATCQFGADVRNKWSKPLYIVEEIAEEVRARERSGIAPTMGGGRTRMQRHGGWQPMPSPLKGGG